MDPITILDEAVQTARNAGYECDGWTLQSADDGYVAWLYVEDEEGQASLFETVDVQDTVLQAAKECLAQATELDQLVIGSDIAEA